MTISRRSTKLIASLMLACGLSACSGAPPPVAVSQSAAEMPPPCPPPSAPRLTADSDTGRSQTDNITRDDRPDFRGTAQAGARVEVYIDSTSFFYGSNNAYSDGTYVVARTSSLEIGIPIVSEGKHSFYARQQCASGKWSDFVQGPDVTTDYSVKPAPGKLTIVNQWATGTTEANSDVYLWGFAYRPGTDASGAVWVDQPLTMLGTVRSDAAGKFSIFIPDPNMVPRQDRWWLLGVAVVDTAGNQASNNVVPYLVPGAPPPLPPL